MFPYFMPMPGLTYRFLEQTPPPPAPAPAQEVIIPVVSVQIANPVGSWTWGTLSIIKNNGNGDSIMGSGSGGDTIFFYDIPEGTYMLYINGIFSEDGLSYVCAQAGYDLTVSNCNRQAYMSLM